MSYDEFLRQLGKAGLKIGEFSELIKMNRNSITNCSKTGSVPSHLAVIATLMGEMAEHQIDYRKALSKIEIKAKMPRGAATIGRFGGSKQGDLKFPQAPGERANQ